VREVELGELPIGLGRATRFDAHTVQTVEEASGLND